MWYNIIIAIINPLPPSNLSVCLKKNVFLSSAEGSNTVGPHLCSALLTFTKPKKKIQTFCGPDSVSGKPLYLNAKSFNLQHFKNILNVGRFFLWFC